MKECIKLIVEGDGGHHEYCTVGEDGVTKITESWPDPEGYPLNWLIEREDGTSSRTFEVLEVAYPPDRSKP